MAKPTFNPASILDTLLEKQLDPSIFEAVDERDIEKAPNFIEWVLSPKFLNSTLLPRQFEMGLKLFAEWCPRCSKPGYIDTLFDQSIGNIKDNIVILEHGVCPKCKVTKFELITKRELLAYNEFVGCMGQRSGKSKFVALVASYVLHRFLKIPNPCRHFNQTSGDILSGTFSSLNAAQAGKNLWGPFRGFIDGSPWFTNYHKFLKTEGKRLGAELLLDRRQFLNYTGKRILFTYTGSVDRTIRGETRIFAAPDEIGWMVSDESKKDLTIMNADGVYTALSNSLATMRMKYNQIWSPDSFDNPPILMCSTSSPSAAKDKIMRLLQDSQINEKMLAYNLASWEANNDYTYEKLRAEFASMPEDDFMRDFGAQPPLASNPFISDIKYINQNATGNMLSSINVEVKMNTDTMGYTTKYLEAKVTSADRITPKMLVFDLGYTKNGFGMCMLSLGAEKKPRLDFVYHSVPEKGCNLNLPLTFENFTKVLVQNFNIKYAFFDRWQSIDQVQRLRDLKVDANMYSMKYRDMTNAKGVITSGGIILPKLPGQPQEIIDKYLINDPSIRSDPMAQLVIQMLTARDTGFTVTKPLQGDDDILRAFLLGITKFSDNKIMESFVNAPTSINSGGPSVRALGVIRTKSNPSAGGGRPSGSQSASYAAVRTKSELKKKY